MRFASMHFLYLLVAIPFIYLAFLLSNIKRYRIVCKLGNPETLNQLSKRELLSSYRVEGLFATASIFFFIIALARPQAGTRLEPVKIKGSDLYIAIDLSQSMKAEDIKPNRLERAKIDARELIHSLNGDRVGLILFAGDAFVQCPLTTDYDAILSLINTIDPDSTVAAGTSLAAPMEVALKSLKTEQDTYSLLLLLTDGEDTVGEMEKPLKELKRRGIKVFTIGIGKKEGVPIPLFDQNGNRVGYKKDKHGKVVITMLDEVTLRWLAEITGGYYFRAGDTFDEIKRFKSTLDNLMKREYEMKKFTVYEERYQIFLIIGLIFAGAFILRTTRVQRRLA